MIYKRASPKPNHVRVVFELPAFIWADQIALVADFNGWDPSATPFRQDRDGVWRVEVDLPIRKQFAFRYLINGVWATDYHADGVAPAKGNGVNSVVCTDPIAVHPQPCPGSDKIPEEQPCVYGWEAERRSPPQPPNEVEEEPGN